MFPETRSKRSPSGKASSDSAALDLAAEAISVAFERLRALLDADTFQLWRPAEGDDFVAPAHRESTAANVCACKPRMSTIVADHCVPLTVPRSGARVRRVSPVGVSVVGSSMPVI